jgi:putative flippase GtrA
MTHWAGRLPNFALTGALGFLVDAGLMALLHAGWQWHPIFARCVSFPVALTVTWLVNRRWVFAPSHQASVTTEYARYVAVQVTGAAVNLAIFAVLIYACPPLMAVPVLALAIAAVGSLVLNYLLLVNWVYSLPHSAAPQVGTVQLAGYSGVTNLEVMAQAVRYNDFLTRTVIDAAPAQPVRVIDFGAGTGTFAAPLAAMGLPVVAVEADGALRRQLADMRLSVLESLDGVEDGSVDYLYTLNVLEHIVDDEAIVARCFRVLRRGGTVLIYVPAFMILFGPMDRLVGHLRRYRLQHLRELVRRAGFVVDRVEYVDSLGFMASLLLRFGGARSGVLNEGAVRFYDRWCFPLSRFMDRVTRKLFGKNLLIIAHRPDGSGG